MEKSYHELEKINQPLLEVIHNNNWHKKLLEGKAILVYNHLKDPLLQNNTKAVLVVDGELTIHVKSPIYAQQLSLMSISIISQVNRALKKKVIRKLRFQVGDIEREDEGDDLNFDPIKDISLTEKEQKLILNEVQSFEDQNLKKSLIQLYTAIIKNSKKEQVIE